MSHEAMVEEIVRQVVARLGQMQAPVAAAPPAPAPAKPAHAPAASSGGGGGYDDPAPATATKATIEAGVQTGACRVGVAAGPGCSDTLAQCSTLTRYIDHTLLKPDATEDQVVKLCQEARQFGFASVCVNSSYVPICAQLLSGTGVKVCTVVGFPLGAMSTESKAFETYDAVRKGADEIDMVINVGELKSGNLRYVLQDIEGVIRAAQGRTVKVILETSSLTDDEKITACILCKAAGADFVKTSTGFAKGGATVADVALMRRTVGPQMGVKASGGIRTCDDASSMLQAGATRIGASASVAIVNEK